MDRQRLIEIFLPPQRRLPKWTAMLLALTRPLQLIYDESVGTYTKLKRRAACDGSTIALKVLIKAEFGAEVEIIEAESTKTNYITLPGEALKGMVLAADNYIYISNEGGANEYDYTVKLIEPATDGELLKRISAVVGIYNSAGITYNVTN